MIATILILLVAAVHFYFLWLEMFSWDTPRTRAIFGISADLAPQTVVMAANQGLYNGFLAVGLLVGLATGGGVMLPYLLLCIIVAGVYAAYCGITRALYVQTLPAGVALAALTFGI